MLFLAYHGGYGWYTIFYNCNAWVCKCNITLTYSMCNLRIHTIFKIGQVNGGELTKRFTAKYMRMEKPITRR